MLLFEDGMDDDLEPVLKSRALGLLRWGWVSSAHTLPFNTLQHQHSTYPATAKRYGDIYRTVSTTARFTIRSFIAYMYF